MPLSDTALISAHVRSFHGIRIRPSCLYPTGKESLEEAETLMLENYCVKAQMKDGQDVLDLGCGAFLWPVRSCF